MRNERTPAAFWDVDDPLTRVRTLASFATFYERATPHSPVSERLTALRARASEGAARTELNGGLFHAFARESWASLMQTGERSRSLMGVRRRSHRRSGIARGGTRRRCRKRHAPQRARYSAGVAAERNRPMIPSRQPRPTPPTRVSCTFLPRPLLTCKA